MNAPPVFDYAHARDWVFRYCVHLTPTDVPRELMFSELPTVVARNGREDADLDPNLLGTKRERERNWS